MIIEWISAITMKLAWLTINDVTKELITEIHSSVLLGLYFFRNFWFPLNQWTILSIYYRVSPKKNKANKMSFYSIPLATSCEHQFCHWLCHSQSVAEIRHSVMETYDLVSELKPHRLMTSLSVRYGGILPSNFQIHPIFIHLCNC